MSAPPAHPRRRRRTIDEPITLTKVVTRSGDAGITRLGDGARVEKDHPRIEACGTVDELTCTIGWAAAADVTPAVGALLARIQNELFDLGADLTVRADRDGLRIGAEQVQALEDALALVNARLTPLRSFVLPGGSETAARLHIARAVCRRAERRVVALARSETVNPRALTYLNRLSDLLFVLARDALARAGADEPRWRPGATTAARADEHLYADVLAFADDAQG
jgi:cob(I)alamin adenosyltransferase